MRTLEWAAGLFEGEGTILIRKRPEDQIALSLTSTDEDVVTEFFRVVNGGRVYGPYQYKSSNKPFWKWNADGRFARPILKLLLPYLCKRRGQRAEEALRRYDERQLRAHYTVSRKGMGGRLHHVKYKTSNSN